MAAIGGASLGVLTGHSILDQGSGQIIKLSDLAEGLVKTEANSLTSTEGSFASRSAAAQYFFAYPHGTPTEDMFRSDITLQVAEVGSVTSDVSGSGRPVVYLKGTASPGGQPLDHDFVIKVYLNSDGKVSVGVGETGAELHEDGDIKGGVWGQGGLKAYIDSK